MEVCVDIDAELLGQFDQADRAHNITRNTAVRAKHTLKDRFCLSKVPSFRCVDQLPNGAGTWSFRRACCVPEPDWVCLRCD
jgi:hypothetical protein